VPLKSREATFHFPAIFMPPALGPIKVLVFAGPSVFRLAQTQVTNLVVKEEFPYDTVTISDVTTEEKKGTFWGYHAGADVSVFFTRLVGVGGGVRYTHANVGTFEQTDAATKGTAGGVSATAGVRFRFNSR
jgi:opacity protein-like surface antigen